MPNNLQLDVLVDFIVQAAKIDDSRLISQIKQRLSTIKVPTINVDALVDFGNQKRLDKELASIKKGLGEIEAIPARVKKAYDDLGKQRLGQLFPSQGDLDAAIKASTEAATKQFASTEQTLRNALKVTQEEFSKKSGYSREQAFGVLQGLVDGTTKLSDLEKDPKRLQAAKDANQYLNDRITAIKQLRSETTKLSRTVQVPVFDSDKDGLKKIGTRSEPGVAVSVSGLDDVIDTLSDVSKKAKKALDTGYVKDLDEKVAGLKDRVKNDLNPALADTEKRLKSISLPGEVASQLKGDLASLRGSIEETRSLRDALSRAKTTERRDQLASDLYKRIEGDEKRLQAIRSNIESQISRQREYELGRYIKRAGELSRSVVAEQQRDVGAALLKGAKTPELAIEGLREPVKAKSVIEELRGQVRASAQELVNYTEKAKGASLAQDENFANLQRKLARNEQLLVNAQQQLRSITQAATPAGARTADNLTRTTRNQLNSLDELIGRLGDAKKAAESSRLSDVDRKGYLDELDSRANEARRLQSALYSTIAESDLGARRGQINSLKDDTRDLTRNVGKLEKQFKDSAVAADRLYKSGATALSADRGAEIIAKRGLTDETIKSLTSYQDLNSVLDELDRKTAGLTEKQRQYADEVDRGVGGAKQKYDDVTRSIGELNRQTTLATRELGKFNLDDEKLNTQANRVVASISRAGGQADSLVDSLGKVSKGLPGDKIEGLTDRVNTLRGAFSEVETGVKKAFTEAADPRAMQNAITTAQNKLSGLQTTFADLQRDITAAKSEGVASDRLTREREAAAVVDRGDQIIADAAKQKGIKLPEAQKFPAEAVAAAVGAIGASDVLRQKELEASIDNRLLGIEQERQDVMSKTRDIGREQADARAGELEREYGLIQDQKDLLRKTRADAQKARRAEAKADVDSLSDAQRRYAQRDYNIDLDEVRELNRGLTDVKRGIAARAGEIRGKMRQLRDDLGEPAARANPEYQKLNDQLRTLSRQMSSMRRLSREVGDELRAVGSASSPEQIAKLRIARRQIAQGVIERGGGVEGLAASVGRLSKDDLAQLPIVRDELRERLATRQAKLADLVASGADRQSAGYKQVSGEALNLEKAIGRINTRLRGYYTLTSQIGALGRQFARYGLGYAALYQALFGVRQLVSGVAELDSALISIKAVVQATDKEMATIEKSIKRVALATQFTTGQIASAAQVLAQAGVEAKDFPNALTSVAAFASATESSIQISADLLSSFRNVFKDMEDLQIANQLTRAVNISKLTAEDLKTIISLSAQMADSYNLASEQYLSAVSTLRNAGIKASTVATGLRQSLIEIFSPDSKTIKVLQKRSAQLGEDVTDSQLRQRFFGFSQAEDPLLEVLRELKRLGFAGSGAATFSGRTFDVRAENAINGLIKNLDEYVQSQAEVVFGNAAIVSSQTQMESLSASARNLGAALVATSHNLTSDLLPGLEDLIDGMTDAVQGLSDFNSRLKSEIGTSFGDLVISGALASAVALKRIPTGYGVLKGAGFVGGSALAGGAAAYAAQNAAQEAGAGETTTRFAADAAAILTAGIIGNAKGVIGGIRKKLEKIIPVAVAAKSGKVFDGAKALGSTIYKALGPIGKGFGTLLKFFKVAGGPFGWALSLASLAGSAYLLVSRWIGTGRAAEERLKEANKRALDAQAQLDLFNQQSSQFKPTNVELGYEAQEGTIAQSGEKLRANLTEFGNTLSNLFGVSSDITEEETRGIVDLLRRIVRLAPEAGDERTRQFKLLEQATGVDFTSTPLAQQQGDELVSLISDLDNTSAGLFKGLQKTYRYAVDNFKNLKPDEDVNDAFALFVKALVEQEGLRAEMLGLAEANVDQVDDFMSKLISGFITSKGYLDLASAKLESNSEAKRLQLQNTLEFLNDSFLNYQDKLNYLLQNIKIPETPEEFAQFEKDEAQREEVRNQVLDEAKGLLPAISAAFSNVAAIVTGGPRRDSPVAESEASVRASRETETVTREQYFKDRAAVERDEEAELADAIITYRQLIKLSKEGNRRAKLALDQLERGLDFERPPAASQFVRDVGGLGVIGGKEDPLELAKDKITVDQKAGVISFPSEKEFRDAFFSFVNRSFQGAIAEESKDSGRKPLFEDTYEFLELRDALTEARNEVTRFKKAKNFDKLQDALVKLRDSELALAEANIRFLKRTRPGKDATEAQVVAHEKKIRAEEERIRQIRERYQAANVDTLQKLLKQTQARTKAEIDAFKKLSADQAASPFFSAFGDVLKNEPAFQEAVDKHVRALTDSLILSGEDPKTVQLRIEAFKAEHRSLLEFTDVIKKATEATEAYVEAVGKINAADAVGTSSNVGLEVIRRDYNIAAPADERRAAVVQQAALEKGALDANLKAYATVSGELTKAINENASKQTIASLTEQLAILEDQLQDNVDRLAEFRSISRGINLDILGELNKGFSPQGILSDLRRQTEEEVMALGDTIRQGFEDAFDGVSDVITDAIFGDLEGDFLENLDNIVRDVFKQMAKDIVKTAVKTALTKGLEAVVPQQFQQFINPQQQAAGNAVVTPSQAAAAVAPALTAPGASPFAAATAPLFPSATGLPSVTDSPVAQFLGGGGATCPIKDECFQSLADAVTFGTDTPAATALKESGIDPFSTSAEGLPDVAASAGDVASPQEGFFAKLQTGLSDLWTSLTDTLSNALTSAKDLLGNLLVGSDGSGGLLGIGTSLLGAIGINFGGATAMTGGTISGGTVKKPMRRAGGGLLDRLRGSDKVSAVQKNFESEKSEQREMLGDALEDKLKEEGILKRGMGGMVRMLRRGRGGTVDDMSLGDAIRGTHGGMIKGPGTGTSDSIPGVIVDSSGRPKRGILVSDGEAILNAGATAKLGKPTIDWLNTNAAKMANGGLVGTGLQKIHQATQSVAGGATKVRMQEKEQGMDMDRLGEMLAAQSQEPGKMRLEVSDTALNRTLRDYIEDYWADVVATR